MLNKNKICDFLKECLLLCYSSIVYAIKKLFVILPKAIDILNPYVSMIIFADLTYKRGMVKFGSEWFVPVYMWLLSYMLKMINKAARNVSESEGVPVARKRFTKKTENGSVVFDKNDIFEMVEYLNEVENFCERNGRYRKTRIKGNMIVFVIIFSILIPLNAEAKGILSLNLSDEEKVILQQVALAEAENQGIGGMVYVMQTIINRVESDEFPDTIYDVISQEGEFATFVDGKYLECEPNNNSKQAMWLVGIVENKKQLYFENPSAEGSSWHADNLEYLFQYEDHIFYK